MKRRGPSVPAIRPYTALRIIVFVVGAGLGWSLGANIFLDYTWETSRFLSTWSRKAPVIAGLICAIAFAVFRDACPRTRWTTLLWVAIASACIGHCFWPISP